MFVNLIRVLKGFKEIQAHKLELVLPGLTVKPAPEVKWCQDGPFFEFWRRLGKK